MRFLSVFRKSLIEQLRNFWVLILVIICAPVFVFAYWLFVGGGGSTTFDVLVINEDAGATLPDGTAFSAGEGAVVAIEAIAYPDGQPILDVALTADRAGAEAQLRERDAAALIIIPADFSQVLAQAMETPAATETSQPVTTDVTLVGDLTNPYYAVAAVMASAAVDEYVTAVTGETRPVGVTEIALGASGARTEFEIYVPGLLVFAVVMLVFPVAMDAARESETGTLRRLQLTRMTAFDFLAGISAVQTLVGIASIVLAFLTATALGFRSQGPLWVAMLVGAVSALSVVGVGLIVAAFSRTVTEAFVIANFPLILLMFFSGIIFPIPGIPLFTVAGRSIGLYDILPLTHGVVALNKVLVMGAGLGDIVFELCALLALTVVYFALGVWLFQRRHMRAR
jgi:ABC-2 type transport system permease protein